ncbi:MAG: rhodanese-like domain-containing protein [Betaproteobacteria bacterium]|nr:rhodanese-like domain-containing protein [Betaproteobacteria bacterium]
MDETTTEILQRAQQRAKNLELPYHGALLPAEAYKLMQKAPDAQIVDIRSNAELDWVGRIPGAIEIELRTYPGMQPNSNFLDQLSDRVDKSATVLFICRSGARSNHAAAVATQSGFTDCYNVLEGFEGDKDEAGHRGTLSGWKVANLPWEQS